MQTKLSIIYFLAAISCALAIGAVATEEVASEAAADHVVAPEESSTVEHKYDPSTCRGVSLNNGVWPNDHGYDHANPFSPIIIVVHC
jgi:hypothetical protein